MSFDALISWLIRSNWLFLAIWIVLLAGAAAAGFGQNPEGVLASRASSRKHGPRTRANP
jgi:hypothetical protein